jgi:hypothetical protein
MTDDILRVDIICTAFRLLGEKYDSPEARQIMAAIAYQESNFEHRHQIGGPAHGFWQFEQGGGVRGVMNFPTTKKAAQDVCQHFGIEFTSETVFAAIENNDILAAAFARLLLWTDPRPIPTDSTEAWDYYIRNWRPGKPHPNRWVDAWEKAIDLWN